MGTVNLALVGAIKISKIKPTPVERAWVGQTHEGRRRAGRRGVAGLLMLIESQRTCDSAHDSACVTHWVKTAGMLAQPQGIVKVGLLSPELHPRRQVAANRCDGRALFWQGSADIQRLTNEISCVTMPIQIFIKI